MFLLFDSGQTNVKRLFLSSREIQDLLFNSCQINVKLVNDQEKLMILLFDSWKIIATCQINVTRLFDGCQISVKISLPNNIAYSHFHILFIIYSYYK